MVAVRGNLGYYRAVKRPTLSVVFSVTCSLVLLVTPLAATAEGQSIAEATEPPQASVIITELQTGAATASDEFIELYNTADTSVDITGWQVRYANSTVTDGASTLLLEVASPDGAPVILPAHTYYLLHTASVAAPAGADHQLFTAGLSKTDKAVALFRKDEAACQLVVEDAVAWEASPNTTKGEGAGLAVPSAATNKDKLLIRYVSQDGTYVDVNNNAHDFMLGLSAADATPAAANVKLLPVGDIQPNGAASQLSSINISGCTLPESEPEGPVVLPPTESPPSTSVPPATDEPEGGNADPLPVIPASNLGLKPPQISELLPNPAPPLTDVNDEFIELYNANSAPFDLSGYILEVGLTTKRRYVISSGTTIQPHAFLAFFSEDTKLALSNSGSMVSLLDPLATMLVQSEPYGTAKDGQAWLLANGVWQWTTQPTPNALNIVSAPVAKKTSSSKTSKSSSTKGAAVSKTSKSQAQGQEQDVQSATAVASASRAPLHPGVLALIAISALLYGAYEYRHDVANRIYQFRSNRAARAAARQSAKGG